METYNLVMGCVYGHVSPHNEEVPASINMAVLPMEQQALLESVGAGLGSEDLLGLGERAHNYKR